MLYAASVAFALAGCATTDQQKIDRAVKLTQETAFYYMPALWAKLESRGQLPIGVREKWMSDWEKRKKEYDKQIAAEKASRAARSRGGGSGVSTRQLEAQMRRSDAALKDLTQTIAEIEALRPSRRSVRYTPFLDGYSGSDGSTIRPNSLGGFDVY